VKIAIIDNDEWEPDMDFHVEIYELETGKRFSGDDTRTVVTILDEDFPGTLGFETVNVETSKH
jgi:hypothetical protein